MFNKKKQAKVTKTTVKKIKKAAKEAPAKNREKRLDNPDRF